MRTYVLNICLSFYSLGMFINDDILLPNLFRSPTTHPPHAPPTNQWLIFLQQLWAPMPIMIWIAIIVEGAIENWSDFGILLGIQMLNASLGYYEIVKAGDAVAALKKSLKPLATVKRDGKWSNIDAGLVVPGDLVLLASGSAIPAVSRNPL